MDRIEDIREEYVDDNIEKSTNILESYKLDFDKETFEKGFTAMSEDCGKIMALMTIGISEELAIQYLTTLKSIEHEKQINSETCKHNIDINKDTCENNLKITQLNMRGTL